jgi:hypothetical protein
VGVWRLEGRGVGGERIVEAAELGVGGVRRKQQRGGADAKRRWAQPLDSERWYADEFGAKSAVRNEGCSRERKPYVRGAGH